MHGKIDMINSLFRLVSGLFVPITFYPISSEMDYLTSRCCLFFLCFKSIEIVHKRIPFFWNFRFPSCINSVTRVEAKISEIMEETPVNESQICLDEANFRNAEQFSLERPDKNRGSSLERPDKKLKLCCEDNKGFSSSSVENSKFSDSKKPLCSFTIDRETINFDHSSGKRKYKGGYCMEKFSENKDSKRKERPTHFVAVQISDCMIHNSVQNIQDHISNLDARLSDIMISLPTLHITLMVLCVRDEEIYKRAMTALTNVHNELNDIMCKQPLVLEFNGLGHFRNRVLYAKILENESYKRLRGLTECVKTHFAKEEIFSTDKRTEFNPHLTIAKIDFSKKKQRAIKKIDPTLYEKYVDHCLGSETIQSIQLLRMSGPKDTTGYYTGDKLCFRL